MAIVNKLTGRKIIPNEIHFDHCPICKMIDYKRLLRVTPSFSRSMVRIYYPRSLADEVIVGADPVLYAVLRHHLNDLASEMPDENDLASIIANNIRRGLRSNTVTLEHIASELGVEPRTLQRRLVKDGTSFQKIFDRS